MARVWTHGVWTVSPGREDEFVTEWRNLLGVGLELGAGEPKLLRDREHGNVFRSFGSWPDIDAVDRFRAEVGPQIGAMDELLDGMEIFTLDEVYPGG